MFSLVNETGALLTTFTLGRAYVVVDMWDHPVNDRGNLLSEDRLHFSTSGQAVLATEVVEKRSWPVPQNAPPRRNPRPGPDRHPAKRVSRASRVHALQDSDE